MGKNNHLVIIQSIRKKNNDQIIGPPLSLQGKVNLCLKETDEVKGLIDEHGKPS